MKVWLDVWDRDSGFHFPDRKPGRCTFQLPGSFFFFFSQESWNNQTEHQTPNALWTQQKGQLLYPSWALRKTDTEQVGFRSSSPRCCHCHWTLYMCLKHEIGASCFPLWSRIMSSRCSPVKWSPHWHTGLWTCTDSLQTLGKEWHTYLSLIKTTFFCNVEHLANAYCLLCKTYL